MKLLYLQPHSHTEARACSDANRQSAPSRTRRRENKWNNQWNTQWKDHRSTTEVRQKNATLISSCVWLHTVQCTGQSRQWRTSFRCGQSTDKQKQCHSTGLQDDKRENWNQLKGECYPVNMRWPRFGPWSFRSELTESTWAERGFGPGPGIVLTTFAFNCRWS